MPAAGHWESARWGIQVRLCSMTYNRANASCWFDDGRGCRFYRRGV